MQKPNFRVADHTCTILPSISKYDRLRANSLAHASLLFYHCLDSITLMLSF